MHCCRLSLVGVLLFAIGALSEVSAADELDEMRAAWTRRKEQVRSAKITWRETHFLPKGAAYGRANPDLEFKNDRSILIDGHRVRSTLRRVGNEELCSDVVFSDGMISGYHGTPTRLNNAHPVGSIVESERFSQANLSVLLPIFWSIRMNEAIFRTSMSGEMTLEPTRGTFEGTEFIVITDRNGRTTEELWIAPSKGFNVLRRIYRGGAITTMEAEIAYERHPMGWFPKAWKTRHRRGDRLMGEWRAVVKEFQLNAELTDADFEISFPPGTLVHNRISGSSFLARENGERRYIVEADHGATYEQLLMSNTGEAHLQK